MFEGRAPPRYIQHDPDVPEVISDGHGGREAAFEFLINGPEVDVGDWALQRFDPVGLAAG